MVHYSLGFTAYKTASGGGFISMWDSKGCGVKDYKVKSPWSEDPYIRGSYSYIHIFWINMTNQVMKESSI